MPPIDLIKITGGPNLQEWGDPATYEQVWDSGKAVARKWASGAGDAWEATKGDVDDPVGKALGRLMENK